MPVRSALSLFAVCLAVQGCAGATPADKGPRHAEQPTVSREVTAKPSPPLPRSPTQPVLQLGDEVIPKRYELDLTLSPDEGAFSGVVRVDVEVRQPIDHLWLNGEALEITKAMLHRGDAAQELTLLAPGSEYFLGFSLQERADPGPANLEIHYRGAINDQDPSGIYRQQLDGRWYIYSQMEPISARRAFPCFDEPRFKVPWKVTLHVPQQYLAFSNTPIEEEQLGSSDPLKKVAFRETKPLPSYLLAVAVGPFDVVDAGKAGRNATPVRIIVPKGRSAEARFARTTTVQLQELLEEYFDIPYPYDKIDHIAVPSFFGAMENPGLITYNKSLLLAKPPFETGQFRDDNADVVAHELAHQWFGNLVTLAWWDDTWLNEAFATWLAAKVVDRWQPHWDKFLESVTTRNRVMKSDRLMTIRRIRQPIQSEHDIVAAFDEITYKKGASVLAMFEHWVGEKSFREGVRAYLHRHSHGTARAIDFLRAMETASRPDVASAFSTFLDQAGTPLVSLDLHCEENSAPTVVFSQRRSLPIGSTGTANAQRWDIPVCLTYGTTKREHEQCFLLKEPRYELVLAHTAACPTWLMANADGAGYYRVGYGGDMLEKIAVSPRVPLSTAEKLALVGNLEAQLVAGTLNAAEALSIISSLANERNYHIVASTAELLEAIMDHLVPPELEPSYARFVRTIFARRARQLGWSPKRGEDRQTQLLRSRLLSLVAIAGQDRMLIRQATAMATRWLKTGKGIDKDVLPAVLAVAAHYGPPSLYARFSQALARTQEPSQRVAILGGMARFHHPDAVEQNFNLLATGALRYREATSFLFAILDRDESRQGLYERVRQRFDEFAAQVPEFLRRRVLAIVGSFCDREHYEDAKTFFVSRANAILGGPQLLSQMLEKVNLCIAYKRVQADNVAQFLRGE